jgi:hypothetical protein
MVEAVRTSATSVDFNETTMLYIPGRCHHHTCRRENIKSHMNMLDCLPIFLAQAITNLCDMTHHPDWPLGPLSLIFNGYREPLSWNFKLEKIKLLNDLHLVPSMKAKYIQKSQEEVCRSILLINTMRRKRHFTSLNFKSDSKC